MSPGVPSHRTAPAGLEIERKFLVAEPPADLESHPSERIAQGYLADDARGAEVRLRRAGDETLLTIKQGRGLSRTEVELAIDAAEFDRLWAGTGGRRIEKRRFRVPAPGGLVIEVDRYDGDLAGLITAEVEFPSETSARAFQAPDWLRPEVTGDPRYANARLAVDGIPDRRLAGDHALLDGEPVAAGVAHVAMAEIDEAADALQGRDALDHAKAVHVARKAFKRGKALVRLAQPGLGAEVADRDKEAFRRAGQLLAGTRDAEVALGTLAGLAERYPGDLPDGSVAPLRAALEADRAREAGGGEAAITSVLALLEVLRGDVARWDLGPEPADALADGLARVHRRGRKAYRAAVELHDEPVTDALHDLRKRAKDLWHAAELLEVAAPKRLRALAASAHALSDLIGDDHDLAVLDARTAAFAAADPAQAEGADAIAAAIRRRRAKLQRRAFKLGGELYGESPSAILERVRELDDR